LIYQCIIREIADKRYPQPDVVYNIKIRQNQLLLPNDVRKNDLHADSFTARLRFCLFCQWKTFQKSLEKSGVA